ncbi:tetratricopeptide repeat protein [Flavobacterium sp. LC2016-01]|uniref:tetratricopeptide repeat protein n=1 Tax=Flavobacterium sp. LC2016-01 TaxID=2675876 RepID=UPI0012BAF9E2|nr:tetratricopeptide repeat protein [Flavobacterium sp. LC2016-01]MTH15429.1 tetratricopeptide repeat protein [Flavobacterium sp. LC2016-01]
MNKILLLLIASFIFPKCISQTLESNREKIETAKTELKEANKNFSTCIVKSDLKLCVDELIKNGTNEYKKYSIGGVLYEIDADQSFKLHEEAYLSNTNDKYFLLEYAIELHRKGKYTEAAKLYERYSENTPKDVRAYAWLSDCYINTGEIEKSLLNWRKTNHAENHISIDNAMFIIYGKTTQIKTRSDLRSEIDKGKTSSFYPLLFLDKNWETDWWNTHTQQYFLDEDIKLAQAKLGETNPDFKIIKAYFKIKELEEIGQSEEIKKVLIENKIILENNPIPAFGEFSSDLLRISFVNKFLNENEFYTKRGNELLDLANKTKDKDLLNIYAYLQASVNGTVNPEIDKLGWKEFKDERFVQSYFSAKANDLKYNDIELNEALKDFPNSSYLFWLKAKCAKLENRPVRQNLIELIKREFKTFGTDPNKYSYRLKSYMGTLEVEKT